MNIIILSTLIAVAVIAVSGRYLTTKTKEAEKQLTELADVAIRLADLAGGLNIDLEEEINKKMNRNKNRKYKHGKKF